MTMFRIDTETGYREKSEKIDMEINLLQATVIHRDIQQVKAITSLAIGKGEGVLNKLLTSKMTCESTKLEGWELMPNCRWILGATTIHLATNWHIDSLVHFLGLRQEDSKFHRDLIKLTSKHHYTPLHVAAIQDNAVVTRFLILKKAQIEAVNDKNQTALHLAAQSGSINNVITLMYDGYAHIMDQDYKKDTPLHLAKTSKILNMLLSKIRAQELVWIEESYEESFFQWLLLEHPNSMKNYLDVMLTSQSDQHLIFDFSIFHHGTNKKQNYLDKHVALINHRCPEMLRHPVMALFAYTKWHPHKIVYYINFAIFLAFLFTFTWHGFITIDLIQCELKKCKGNSCELTWELNSDREECQAKLKPGLEVPRYINWGLLSALMVWELLQFFSKVVEEEILEYFSLQNVTEVCMYILATCFFVIEFKELDDSKKNEYQLSILGWALFLAWIDMTMFLGRFDLFGKNIYSTWRIVKNVFWPIVVYIPTIMAFGTAFNCFLSHNPVFEGSVASIIKVLTMVLGEFDFEDNFLYDNVKENGDKYISAQVHNSI